MGQEIVYCYRCQTRLSGSDFEKRKAFRIGDNSACLTCAQEVLPSLPPEIQAAIRGDKPEPPPGKSSGLLPKPASTTRLRPSSAKTPLALGASGTAAGKSRAGLIGGIAGGVLLVVVIAVAALSGKGKSDEVTVSGASAKAPRAAVADPEAVALAALQRARETVKAKATDFPEQARAWQAAVRDCEGTPYLEQARLELKRVGEREKVAVEESFAGLERDLRGRIDREEFKSALDFCDQALRRLGSDAWVDRIGVKLREIREQAPRLFPQVRDQAVDAKRRGRAADLKKLRERVARWGVGNFAADLEAALAPVTVDPALAATEPAPEPKPEPKPEPAKPAPTNEAAAYRESWEKAMALASLRDFAAAAGELTAASRTLQEADLKKEAQADLDALNLLGTVYPEILEHLSKIPRGQPLSLACLDDGGRTPAEGAVVIADLHRVVLQKDRETTAVLAGEIAGSSLAELLKARPKKADSDARAAALFCVLDGQGEAGRKQQGAWPEKYWEFAKRVEESRARPDAGMARKDAQARGLYYDALLDLGDFRWTHEALPKFARLAAEFADTPFYRRNRAALAPPRDAGKEYFLAVDDLAGSGGFKSGKSAKGVAAWISEADVGDNPAKAKANFVDLQFSAMPETEYRLWVLLGGCCKENFAFFLQATELLGPDPKNAKVQIAYDPGAAAALPLKHQVLYLKPGHSAHGGKPETTRLEWVPVPLPKYAQPGLKTVRILAERQGAAVAAAVVSSLRKEALRESEIKEMEKERADALAAAVGKRPTGSILREAWKGIGGAGIADLLPKLGTPPTDTGLLQKFECPVDWADNYGTRVRGYIHPPVSGEYVFFIASDDQGELWLSTDEDPAHKKKVAHVPDFTSPGQWGKHASQQSAPILLRAGRRYYIEALQKEGGGGDHLAVGWLIPDGTDERPIPGKRLSDK